MPTEATSMQSTPPRMPSETQYQMVVNMTRMDVTELKSLACHPDERAAFAAKAAELSSGAIFSTAGLDPSGVATGGAAIGGLAADALARQWQVALKDSVAHAEAMAAQFDAISQDTFHQPPRLPTIARVAEAFRNTYLSQAWQAGADAVVANHIKLAGSTVAAVAVVSAAGQLADRYQERLNALTQVSAYAAPEEQCR